MAKAAQIAVNICLAQEAEHFPLLWDAKSEAYKRNDLKASAWHTVAENVKKQQSAVVFSADSAKKRFKDLKENFFKTYRKVRDSENKCSGKGMDEMYVPTWPVFKYLMYLKVSCAQAPSVSNIPAASNTLVVWEEVDIPDGVEDSWDLNSVPDSASVCAPTPSPDLESVSASGSSKRPASSAFFTKKGSGGKKSQPPLLDTAMQILEKMSDDPKPPACSQTQAEFEPILVFLNQRLKGMDPETKKKCENDLIDVLRKY